MKILITENVFVSGRPLDAGQVYDLSDDDARVVNAMQKGTTNKAAIAAAEQAIAEEKDAARERQKASKGKTTETASA